MLLAALSACVWAVGCGDDTDDPGTASPPIDGVITSMPATEPGVGQPSITAPMTSVATTTVPPITAAPDPALDDRIAPPDGLRDCGSADVIVVAGPYPGENGDGSRALVVTNVGYEPCVVYDAIEITAHGFRLPDPIAVPAGPGPLPVVYVDPVVAVGESVGIMLQYPDGVSPQSTRIELDLGGDDRSAVGYGPPFAPYDPNAFDVDYGDGMTYQAPVAADAEMAPPAVFWPASTAAGRPIAADDRLSTAGLGAVEPGMTLQQAADATGQAVVPVEWNGASVGCGYARLGGTGDVFLHLNGATGDLDQATITAIGVAPYRGDSHTTPSGLRPGSTEAEVFAALGEPRLSPERDEYSGETHWRFTPADPAERDRGVFFRMRGGVVSEITAGLADHVYRGEGCA